MPCLAPESLINRFKIDEVENDASAFSVFARHKAIEAIHCT
jgi:hypothetical protein